MSDQQQFILRWHYHESTILHNLPFLIENDVLTDITLSVGHHQVRAHKVILAMCSSYFLQLFQEIKYTQHPVIVLHNVKIEDIRAVLSFIYRGQCVVTQDQLPGLLSVGRLLKIQGLCDMKVPETQKDQLIVNENCQNYEQIPIKTEKDNHDFNKRQKTEILENNNENIKNFEDNKDFTWNKNVFDSEKSQIVTQKPEDLSTTHRKSNSKEGSETCKCFLCGKYLSNQYNLRVHMETHQETYHACQSCPHVSRSRDALRKHVSYRHPEEYSTRKRKKINDS